MFVDHERFWVLFGNESYSLDPKQYTVCGARTVDEHDQLQHLVKSKEIKHIVLLNQMHGTDGIMINDHTSVPYAFSYTADYSVTNQSAIALGIVSADCIPLLLVAHNYTVIAALHVGWKGLVAGIVDKAVRMLCMYYNITSCMISAFVGPHARRCCYYVGNTFLDFAAQYTFNVEMITSYITQDYYFDMEALLRFQLRQLGIEAVNTSYAACTIHDHQYASSRRQGAQSRRNVTLIALKR